MYSFCIKDFIAQFGQKDSLKSSLMSKLKHRNIISLIGICMDGSVVRFVNMLFNEIWQPPQLLKDGEISFFFTPGHDNSWICCKTTTVEKCLFLLSLPLLRYILKGTFWRSVSKCRGMNYLPQCEYSIVTLLREIACELCPDWDDQEERG